jgi:hypothetical protein
MKRKPKKTENASSMKRDRLQARRHSEASGRRRKRKKKKKPRTSNSSTPLSISYQNKERSVAHLQRREEAHPGNDGAQRDENEGVVAASKMVKLPGSRNGWAGEEYLEDS